MEGLTTWGCSSRVQMQFAGRVFSQFLTHSKNLPSCFWGLQGFFTCLQLLYWSALFPLLHELMPCSLLQVVVCPSEDSGSDLSHLLQLGRASSSFHFLCSFSISLKTCINTQTNTIIFIFPCRFRAC